MLFLFLWMREREHRKVRKLVQDLSASHSEVKSVCDSKAPSSIPSFLFPYSLTDPELSGGVTEVLAWLWTTLVRISHCLELEASGFLLEGGECLLKIITWIQAVISKSETGRKASAVVTIQKEILHCFKLSSKSKAWRFFD